MRREFEGQIAIVTGAGSGIGKATALRLGENGATVVCADIDGHDRAAQEINETGGQALSAELDVRDSNAWAGLVQRTVEDRKSIDILVNNAGIVVPGDTVAEGSEDHWETVMAVNAKGVWLGMHHVIPVMIAQERGKICNVASTAAHIGLADSAAYCASKGAVVALTRQAGVQYAAKNIQINSVSPGTTMTAIQQGVSDAQRDVFRSLTPINRFAEPDEVAAVIVFLCSEQSSFVTAADLLVDGGMVAF